MTEVKNEALEALETACEKYLYGKAACKEIRTDSHVMADIIAYELRKEGYRIAPVAKPVADETAARCGEAQPGSKSDDWLLPVGITEADMEAHKRVAAYFKAIGFSPDCQWQPIDTVPDSLDNADLFCTYMGKPYRRYLDCKRDKQFNRWYFECPEMGWQPVGGGGIQITHYCVPKLPTPPAEGVI